MPNPLVGACALLEEPVVHVEVFQDVPGPLFPEERALVSRAVERRRQEFTSARACARRALAGLRYPRVPVPSGPSGAPVWPAGVVGSITHCAGYRAAAVVSSAYAVSLGIDAEPNLPLAEPAMLGLIALPEERRHLAELGERRQPAGLTDSWSAPSPAVCWPRLLFSAKGSVYKALNPLSGRPLGFRDATLRFTAEDGTFRAQIAADGPRADAQVIQGSWQLHRGVLLTAVTVM